MEKDWTIERIRTIRHQISAKHKHSPRQLVIHYKEMERDYENRILKEESVETTSPKRVLTDPSLPHRHLKR